MMARKGRKRSAEARRKPNGHVYEGSPAERERETLAVGLEARQRLFGMSADRAKEVSAGTAFGRLYLAGHLAPNDDSWNRQLYLAGLVFERRRRAYRSAISAKGVPSAGDLDRVHGFDGDEDEETIEARQAAVRRYADIRRAILDCGQPLAMFALETWILEDCVAHALLGDLRAGLNAVAKVMEMEVDGRRNSLTA